VEQVDAANASGKQPVVFVHGLWLLPSSWDRWAEVFQSAGFSTVTAGWPDDPNAADEANRHPEVFAHKSVKQVADHVEALIGELKQRPAVIGHSFGGLLAERGCSDASVAISPAPHRGVLPLPISALRSSSPVLRSPLNHGRAVPPTYDQFRYAFTNAVTEDEAHELYNTFAVLAAGLPLFQAAADNLNPWTEVEVKTKNPDRGPFADHRGRAGPHRPLGDQQIVVQAREAQQGERHRDRGDAGPRSRPHDRSRLVRGRRHRAAVRAALREAVTRSR
jgi:non-heme chloroperoxidase